MGRDLCLVIFGLLTGLLIRNWIEKLERLCILADETFANQIVQAERLKSAEIRVRLYEQADSRHMCLAPACRNPVMGNWAFAHCENHLEQFERRWLEGNLESEGLPKPSDDDHPVVRQLTEAIAERDKELIQQNASGLMDALSKARNLLKHARAYEVERCAYLPAKLRWRMERIHQHQKKIISG